MNKRHYLDPYFKDPQHPITVALIGCGGTGTRMLTNLGRIDHALRQLDHPGLHVTAIDDKDVTEASIGRQMFSSSDIGYPKSTTLITRINRFYGNDWDAVQGRFGEDHALPSNLYISCVDNAETRFQIKEAIRANANRQPYEKRYYWLDIGNSRFTGQVVLGTAKSINQPVATVGKGKTRKVLPDVIKMFPDLLEHDDPNEPSCSLAEALENQDLFINSILAEYAANLIWKMFREPFIEYHGVYANLSTLKTNPIPIQ